MRQRQNGLVWIPLIALLLPSATLAEGPPERELPPSIRVTGDASVSVPPDETQIDFGVVTQARTAQAAGSENAERVGAVLAALKRTLGPDASIRTLGYSIRPDYRHPREGGPPTIVGYTASNTVQVKTHDLERVGELIDAATESGSNQIQRLAFTLKDEAPVRAEALRDAARIARAKADAIAEALGLTIARVLSVEEAGTHPVPIVPRLGRAMVAEAAVAPTPVEPGTIEVRATVTLTLEVAE